MKRPKGRVEVDSSLPMYEGTCNMVRICSDFPLTKMDLSAVRAAIRRELRKRGYTVWS